MTIIIFLVDTSASMNQRTYVGTSLLDVAKGAIETFMKIRSRDPNARWDRYMLLTFEEPPGNVKAGWKESHSVFISELKNLDANGLTNLGSALKHTFDLLNVNRMQTGIDTYGQGRCPFYLEPAVIISITDGRRMSSHSGTNIELNLPMNNAVPGSELTKEPFRWDQRLFGLVLRMPAIPPAENLSTFIPSAEDSAIDAMCEVTGGRSYAITSQRMLINCLDSLVQKCQSGVVVYFEKIGQDPLPVGDDDADRAKTPALQSLSWQTCRKMIYVPRSVQKGVPVGHWPIPEAFWPDLASSSLPPRNAQPILKFTCTNSDPMVLENFPFDKYELEPSPLTQYILERRQPTVAWQVFIGNSAKYSDIGHPCGYLKASSNLQTVNLFVMPYNYPVLIPLLDELIKVHKYKPTQQWRQKFESYLKTMPLYYAQPLRRAMSRMGAHNLVPDNMDNCLSYSVVSYLKKLKNQAKVEYEKIVASVGQSVVAPEGIKVNQRTKTSFVQRTDFKQLLDKCNGNMQVLKQELTEFNSFTLHLHNKSVQPQAYRNPFDISRKDLISQLRKMRNNFFHSTKKSRQQDQDLLHNQPVGTMGNYQEYLKKMPQPLREVEASPARMHTFGNPFKVNKNLMIDEADEAMPGQQASRKRSSQEMPSSPRPNKRKPGQSYNNRASSSHGQIEITRGPLPKHVPLRQLMSPRPDHMENSPDLVIELDIPGKNGVTKDDHSHPGLTNHNQENKVYTSATANHIDEDSDSDSGLMIDDQPITDFKTNSKLTNHHSRKSSYPGQSVQHIINNSINSRNANSVKDYNTRLKQLAVKEVKKPGKNYDVLFSHLNTIQGCLDTRCLFVRDIYREALRFKKRVLAKMLEQFEESMVKAKPPKKNNGEASTSTKNDRDKVKENSFNMFR